MKKAVIVIQTKNTKTKKYGEEIASFLLRRGLAAELIPINNFEPKKLEGADYLLLGNWASKSFFSSQADDEWITFTENLPKLEGRKTAIFATYKVFAGNIFRKMKKYLSHKVDNLEYVFKSRDGSLSIPDQLTLNDFIR